MSEVHTREFDYLLFQRKKLIGCFIIWFNCSTTEEKVADVGQITEIYATDVCFFLKVDGNTWLLYLWDGILPYVTEDDRTITVFDKIADVKFVIVKQKDSNN
jgi:hypothetical protein